MVRRSIKKNVKKRNPRKKTQNRRKSSKSRNTRRVQKNTIRKKRLSKRRTRKVSNKKGFKGRILKKIHQGGSSGAEAAAAKADQEKQVKKLNTEIYKETEINKKLNGELNELLKNN